MSTKQRVDVETMGCSVAFGGSPVPLRKARLRLSNVHECFTVWFPSGLQRSAKRRLQANMMSR